MPEHKKPRYVYSKPAMMANTYTQLQIQLVFAVKYRAAMISKEWKHDLHKYITGIFQKNKHKMLQLNSMPDHIHILIGLGTTQSISSIVQNVKSESSKWIEDRKLCPAPFNWQTGYGAFSYSKRDLPNVIRYIQNQEVHHKKEAFLDEYTRLMNDFEIDYEEQYIFKEPE